MFQTFQDASIRYEEPGSKYTIPSVLIHKVPTVLSRKTVVLGYSKHYEEIHR